MQGCENIHIPVCQNMWYNYTHAFPSVQHPEVTSQTDVIPLIYVAKSHFNPTPQCADFFFVDCSRHLPPCLEGRLDETILPCRKTCKTASYTCNYYSYNCDDLPNTGPCTTPNGLLSSVFLLYKGTCFCISITQNTHHLIIITSAKKVLFS